MNGKKEEIAFHGQRLEDKYVYETFFRGKETNGTPVFLELGAMDGYWHTNTKAFEETLGWKGILIEPHPTTFRRLKKNRPNAVLFNEIVSDETGLVRYRYSEHTPGVAGVDETMPDSVRRDHYADETKTLYETRAPRRLDDIVAASGFERIDFLSLDVEGHELNVLRSMDFSRFPTYVLLVEALPGDEEKNSAVRSLLEDAGFALHGPYEHNEVYVHEDVPFVWKPIQPSRGVASQ